MALQFGDAAEVGRDDDQINIAAVVLLASSIRAKEKGALDTILLADGGEKFFYSFSKLILTGRAAAVMTNFPCNLPLNVSSALSVVTFMSVASPLTVPFVPGDHAFGYERRGLTCEPIRCAE